MALIDFLEKTATDWNLRIEFRKQLNDTGKYSAQQISSWLQDDYGVKVTDNEIQRIRKINTEIEKRPPIPQPKY